MIFAAASLGALLVAAVAVVGVVYWLIEIVPRRIREAYGRRNESTIRDGVCPKCGGDDVKWRTDSWRGPGMKCSDCFEVFVCPGIIAQRVRDARAKKVDEFIKEQARKDGAR